MIFNNGLDIIYCNNEMELSDVNDVDPVDSNENFGGETHIIQMVAYIE